MLISLDNVLCMMLVIFYCAGIWTDRQEGARSTSRAYRIHCCSLLNWFCVFLELTYLRGK